MTRIAALVAAGALVGITLVLAGGDVHPCDARGSLPDVQCTPGSQVTHSRALVCGAGFRPAVVQRRSKNVLLFDYGIPSRERARYRVVALVPLGLGGSRRVSNLWPLAIDQRPGPAEKRQLDTTLRSLACRGRISVLAAQRVAAGDWVSAYRRLGPGTATSGR